MTVTRQLVLFGPTFGYLYNFVEVGVVCTAVQQLDLLGLVDLRVEVRVSGTKMDTLRVN